MAPRTSFNLLLVCGSLRQASLNAKLLQVVASLVPPGLRCTFDTHLAELPLYNEDLDTDTPPAPVAAFRAALRAADGLVVASPEYNYGIAGPLKNAVDWGSRPYGNPSMGGKAVVTACATPGEGLGFAGLGQLNALLHALGNFVVANPRVVVQRAGAKLLVAPSGQIELDDPVAKALLTAQLAALHDALLADAGALAQRGTHHYRAMRRPAG